MSGTQIAIRLDADELAALDAEVAAGRSANRSDAVRRSIKRLQREQRFLLDEVQLAAAARRGESLYPDLEGWHATSFPALD